MSKVHIALVGGQPAPVYNAIKYIKPDIIIFIHSEKTLRQVENILSALDDSSAHQEILLNETEPNTIISCAKELAEKYKNDEVSVNISGGLKSWSHLFGLTFQPLPNSSVIYVDQNNMLWNYKTLKSIDISQSFNIYTNFKLYGNTLEHYKLLSNYNDDDRKAVAIIEKARNFSHAVFNKLTLNLTPEQKHTLKFLNNSIFEYNGSFIEWHKASNDSNGYVKIVLNKSKNSKTFEISSPNAVDLTFNTGWFEFKIADLISAWNKAYAMYINCIFKFPFNPNKDKNEIDKNEIDIVIDTGKKILFVECKTQISNITDIDKFRNVVYKYGGLGNKALFITDNKMSDDAKAMCEDNNILTFSLRDHPNIQTAQNRLFCLLNKELNVINEK